MHRHRAAPKFRGVVLMALPLALAGYASAQPLPDRWPLHARVVDIDGRPVTGAMVTLSRQDQTLAVAYWGGSTGTDATGEFTFFNVEEGSYLVRVEGSRGAAGPRIDQAVKRLDFRAPTQRVEITLKPPPRLHILKPDGVPLTSAPIRIVTVRGDPTRDGGMRGGSSTYTRTDANAEVTVQRVAPIPLVADIMTAMTEVTMVVAPGSGVAYLSEMEPDGRGPLEVKLQAGGTVAYVAREKPSEAAAGGADVVKTARPLGGAVPKLSAAETVADDVVPAAQRALAATYFNLNLRSMTDSTASVTEDGTGLGELTDLLPGPYTLVLSLAGYQGSTSAVLRVEASKTVTVDCELECTRPQATVDLQVHLPPNADVGRKDVLLWLQPTGEERRLAGNSRPHARRAHIDADGHLKLYPVPPGEWSLRYGGSAYPVRVTRAAETFTANILSNVLNLGRKKIKVEAPLTSVTWDAEPPRP